MHHLNARLHLNPIKKLKSLCVRSDQIRSAHRQHFSRFVHFRSTQSKTCILNQSWGWRVTRIEEEGFATRFAKMRTACYWIFKHDQSFMILVQVYRKRIIIITNSHEISIERKRIDLGSVWLLWLQRSSTHWVEIKRNSHSFLSVTIYNSFSYFYYYSVIII